MSAPQPEWNEITGSPDEQARAKARANRREEGRRHGLMLLGGAGLLTVGLITIILAAGLQTQILFLPGILLAGLGLALLAPMFETVYRVRSRGRGHMVVEEATHLRNPTQDALDRGRNRRSDQGFSEFLGQTEGETASPPPVVKVRCPSCQALNDEQANFCAGCGSGLR